MSGLVPLGKNLALYPERQDEMLIRGGYTSFCCWGRDDVPTDNPNMKTELWEATVGHEDFVYEWTEGFLIRRRRREKRRRYLYRQFVLHQWFDPEYFEPVVPDLTAVAQRGEPTTATAMPPPIHHPRQDFGFWHWAGGSRGIPFVRTNGWNLEASL